MIENIFNEAGFSCRKSKNSFVTTYIFTRAGADRTERIYLSHRDFSTSQTPNNNKYEVPSIRIAFHQVEQIMAEATGLSQDDLSTIHQLVFPEVDQLPVTGLVSDQRMFDVNTEDEEKLFKEYLKTFYGKGASPFFERYTTLRAVDEHITALSADKMQSFVSDSGGNTAMHRAIVIKLLTHNPGAMDYYRASKKWLLANLHKSVVKRMDDILIKIADKLQIEK